MARTDIHRPSVIDPSEYQFVSMHDQVNTEAKRQTLRRRI